MENKVQNQDERIKKLEENNAIYTIYLEKFNNLENQIKELNNKVKKTEEKNLQKSDEKIKKLEENNSIYI